MLHCFAFGLFPQNGNAAFVERKCKWYCRHYRRIVRELLLVLYYPTVATSHSLSITKCTLVNVSASKVVQRTLPKCLLTWRQALAATIHSALTYSKLHFIRPKCRRLPYALADRQPGNQTDRRRPGSTQMPKPDVARVCRGVQIKLQKVKTPTSSWSLLLLLLLGVGVVPELAEYIKHAAAINMYICDKTRNLCQLDGRFLSWKLSVLPATNNIMNTEYSAAYSRLRMLLGNFKSNPGSCYFFGLVERIWMSIDSRYP